MVRFDEKLGTLTGVDSISNALEIAVVNGTGSETERRSTGVDVLPVVVGVDYAEVAFVFCGVGVGVAHEGGFPVVVDVAVGDCYEVTGVGDLYLDD